MNRLFTSAHQFVKKYFDGSWLVYCFETTGSFNTNLWRLGKIKDQTCPCCKGVCNHEKKEIYKV